jgi:hypothetical protein
MDEELDRFKRDIDLRAYAAAQGYQLDRRESWRGTAVMRRGGDKIVIKRDADGHYVYFSVRDDRDNGTIIDFVKNRQGLTLGAVRQELRRYAGTSPPPLPVFSPLTTTARDRLKVESAYRRMKDLEWHSYLEIDRCIPREVLTSERFAGRIRVDARVNAVFPHFDEEGLCGYELKNRDFTGFAAGGAKGLWESNDFEGDDRLVFAESAIDALSYAVLHSDEHTRYRSIGGKPNPHQPALIDAAIDAMPAGSTIIAAMDNDDAGRDLADVIGQAVPAGMAFLNETPALKDWNDVLKSRSPSFFSSLPPGSGRHT